MTSFKYIKINEFIQIHAQLECQNFKGELDFRVSKFLLLLTPISLCWLIFLKALIDIRFFRFAWEKVFNNIFARATQKQKYLDNMIKNI